MVKETLAITAQEKIVQFDCNDILMSNLLKPQNLPHTPNHPPQTPILKMRHFYHFTVPFLLDTSLKVELTTSLTPFTSSVSFRSEKCFNAFFTVNDIDNRHLFCNDNN